MSDTPNATDASEENPNGEAAEEAAASGEQEAVDPLEAALAESKKHREAWMRSAADFDNFRKRTRRELEDTRKAGREDLLKDFLPVFDNLERAIGSAEKATEIKPVVDGLTMIMKQFIATLQRAGITKVPSVGSPFDPMVHEAIQQVESDEHPPGTIIAEVQPGYMNGDRLVRAAMVVVAKAKAGEGDAEA